MDSLNLALPLKPVARPESRDYIIRDAQGAWIATTGDHAHARRISACVNACEGLEISRLERGGLLCTGLASMKTKRQDGQAATLLREISVCVDRQGWVIPAKWDEFAELIEKARAADVAGKS